MLRESRQDSKCPASVGYNGLNNRLARILRKLHHLESSSMSLSSASASIPHELSTCSRSLLGQASEYE